MKKPGRQPPKSLLNFKAPSQSVKPAKVSKAEKEEALIEEEWGDHYRPHTPLRVIFGYGNQLPPLAIFYRDLEYMLLHPRVGKAGDDYKNALADAEFEIKARDPAVARFLQELFERLWSNSLYDIQQGYHYGWLGMEVRYRRNDDGLLTMDRMRGFHPRDTGYLYDADGGYWGFRLKNQGFASAKGIVDLPGPVNGITKGFWYIHRGANGAIFGLSQYLGAWRPWRRLAQQDGGEDNIDMAVYRFGVQGPKVYYPPGMPNITEAKRDKRQPTNRDKAREIGETYKSGGCVYIPSEWDEKTGNRKWDAEFPDHTLNVDSLVGYNRYLKDEIAEGIGVPPELMQAAETGSGYSGRELPLESFFVGQRHVGRDIVRQFREQVADPLVEWNFGPDALGYEVDLKSLLETRKKRLGGGDGNNGGPWGRFGQPGNRPIIDAPSRPMELGPDGGNGMMRFATDNGQWITIGGKVGDDGKRHGGSPVMIKNGRIVKGHPSLTGKQIGNLKDSTDESTHRQQLNQSREYSKAKFAKDAKKEGIDPKHLHSLAAEIKAHDREFVSEHNQMLKHARQALDKFGGRHRTMGMAGKIGGKGQVEDYLEGLDQVALSIASEYPGKLGNFRPEDYANSGGDDESELSQRLLDYLHEGNREPMTDDEAYGQALEQLRYAKESGQTIDDSAGDAFEGDGDVGDFDFGFNASDASQSSDAKFDLFGNPVPKSFANKTATQHGMFESGAEGTTTAWMDAAKDLAEELGQPIQKMDAGGRVLINGKWYSVKHDGQSWGLMRLATGGSESNRPLEDPQAESIVRNVLSILAPLREKLTRDIVRALRSQSADAWVKVRTLLEKYREEAATGLANARVAAALTAMRRVVDRMTGLHPSPALSPPVAPPSSLTTLADGSHSKTFLPLIEEAVNDLAGRRLLTAPEFYQLANQAKEEAFTVSGVDDVSVLEKIRQSLVNATAQGKSQQEWADELNQQLGSDPFLSDAHQQMVFRNNVHAAYSNGQDAICQHPLVNDMFPYREAYAIHDHRVRPWHLAVEVSGLDGTAIYRADDPTWGIVRGPSDWGCRCGWRPVTKEQAAAKGVREAKEWLRTGIAPANPEWVPPPVGWQQSPDWKR